MSTVMKRQLPLVLFMMCAFTLAEGARLARASRSRLRHLVVVAAIKP